MLHRVLRPVPTAYRSFRSFRSSLACALLAWPALVGGCASTGDGPAPIRVTAAEYDAAFVETVEFLRDEGFSVALRDRRGGMIATEGRSAGSAFEPWWWGQSDLGGTIENTITHQRRRAIIEFIPVDEMPRPIDPDEPIPAVPPPGVAIPGALDGPYDVSVRVVLERAFTPGLRRSEWTRVETTFTFDPLRDPPRDRPDLIDAARWTAVARDPIVEERMTNALRKRLGAAAVVASEVPTTE